MVVQTVWQENVKVKIDTRLGLAATTLQDSVVTITVTSYVTSRACDVSLHESWQTQVHEVDRLRRQTTTTCI